MLIFQSVFIAMTTLAAVGSVHAEPDQVNTASCDPNKED